MKPPSKIVRAYPPKRKCNTTLGKLKRDMKDLLYMMPFLICMHFFVGVSEVGCLLMAVIAVDG